MLYIFDWDGTLSDSASKIVRCMQKAAVDTGLEVLEDDVIRNSIGLGLPEVLKLLYPDSNSMELESLKDHYSRHFIEEKEAVPEFFPGVLDTIEQLYEQGHHLTIATGKSRRGLNRVLTEFNLSRFFHASRCADETASKPHPLMLEELLEQFDVAAIDAVMVGDTEYDMDMAQRLSMPRVAVSYGAHHVDRLKPYDPVLCIDHFPDLLSWSP